MDEIIQIIGDDNANAMRDHFGGTRIYIPRQLHTNHPLIKIIGLAPAAALCRRIKGADIYIQKLPTPLASRNKLIKSERLTGKTLNQLAKENNLSARQISTILKLT